jgi:hypothetical protein
VSTLLIDDLRRDREEALRLFAADPAALARPYAPGKWNGHQVLVHLADAVGVQLDRLRRLQADDKPMLWAFEPNHWAERLLYHRRSLAVAATLFSANLDAIIELATLIPAERYERAGIHSETGRKTFAEVLTFVHWHTHHHLGQVRAAVGGGQWTPAA